MILCLNEAKAEFKEVKQMKRTMKRHLSLILAVLMLLTSVGFSAVAQNGSTCTQHKPADPSNSDYYRVVNPDCENGGYTEYLCMLCGAVTSVGNYTAALGHDWGEEDYEYDEVNDCFYKYYPCTNEYVVKGQAEPRKCDAITYETDENGDKQVYYLACFVNNKVTKEFDSNYKYTNLAVSYKDEYLQVSYVKKGEKAVYNGKDPYRAKDKDFGMYDFIGWSTTPDAEATGELTVNANNTVFYPVFKGDVSIKHRVTFYGIDEQLTYPQSVLHGKAATYKVNGIGPDYYPDPVKEADLVNTYEFAGWVISNDDSKVIKTQDIENTPIYDNVLFLPRFNATKKDYTLKLYQETFVDGKAKHNLYKYEGNEAVFEGIHLETNLLGEDAPEGIALINDPSVITRKSDKTYSYSWKKDRNTGAGVWRVLKADGSYGSEVTLNNFKVNANDIIETKDDAGNVTERTIQLVPVFEKNLIRYTVDIEMAVPYGEDDSYYRGEAEVQVLYYDADGRQQLAAVGKTNADGKFRCYLNYRVPFTINVVSYDHKYIGSQMIFDLVKAETGGTEAEAKLNYQRVSMDLNPEYETHCSCIHHVAFLQPIIVRIYNILYTFFNYKYVCCYDMYSTIGPLLDYMPD